MRETARRSHCYRPALPRSTLRPRESGPPLPGYLRNAVQVGLNFIEVVDPTAAPTYTISSTCMRFPSSTLSTALLSEVQQIVPLIHIRVRESAVAGHLSLRPARHGGRAAILPRLIGIGEPGSEVLISQDIKGTSDNVRFTVGNGDRVMTQLANDTDLKYAEIDLCPGCPAAGSAALRCLQLPSTPRHGKSETINIGRAAVALWLRSPDNMFTGAKPKRCAAVPGTITRGTCVRRIATGINQLTGTTTSGSGASGMRAFPERSGTKGRSRTD